MKHILLIATIILLGTGFINQTDVPVRWTLYAGNPVFSPEPGSWDEGTISDPMVVMFKDTFRMYYECRSQ